MTKSHGWIGKDELDWWMSLGRSGVEKEDLSAILERIIHQDKEDYAVGGYGTWIDWRANAAAGQIFYRRRFPDYLDTNGPIG